MSDNSNLYENLPADPEQAFLVLEARFRDDCREAIRNAHQDDNVNVHYVDYIAQVIAAITELGLQANFPTDVPEIQNVDYSTYLNFSKDVKHYRTRLEIRHGRRIQGYSVHFDAPTKLKVQHHIEQLRDIFGKIDVEQRKKEALLGKLNELQGEVDRERTRFDVYAALVVEVAGVIGQSVEKTKVLEVIDAIGRVMWGSKKEETKRISPPTTPKRIGPPRDDLNDEIPF
jgi:hypothetical protein